MRSFDKAIACSCLVIAAWFAMPCMAGSTGDAALKKQNALYEQSKAMSMKAVDEENEGLNTKACTDFSKSAQLMDDAILVSLEMISDVDYNGSYLINRNAELQNIANLAKDAARRVCAMSDTPLQSSAPVATHYETPAELAEKVALAEPVFHYRTITRIKGMAPYIEKTRAERLTACRGCGSDGEDIAPQMIGKNCADDQKIIEDAEQKSAMKGVGICKALAYWLQDDDGSTCENLKDADNYFKNEKYDDADFISAYSNAGLDGIKERLTVAAGCRKKNSDYWSRNILKVINSVPFFENFPGYEFSEPYADACYNSFHMIDSGYDKSVITIINDACKHIARAEYCGQMNYTRDQLSELMTTNPNAPFIGEVPAVLATISRFRTSAACR